MSSEHLYRVILAPHVSEKASNVADASNHAVFKVAVNATKPEIKKAVEKLFDVKVVRVNTQNRKGKPRRTRFRWGTTKAWKKAIVTLDPEHKIDFF